MSRTGNLAVIAAVVAALTAVWWIDRRRAGIRPVEAPATAARLPRAGPTLDAIADPAERAEVGALAAAIDHGGPFAHADDGAVFADPDHHLPRRPPGFWRAYRVPGGEPRRLVAGGRGELYYTRDGVAFIALRGALP